MPGAHRVIRRIDASEGPYPGTLVTRGGTVAVQVASETISGWAGWEHAGDDHVAAPLDIVRRSDGLDVLLPWCTERISSFIGRRTAADAALAPGEMTTLVASILRGLGELARTGEHDETGEWWLTDDGRPTFVIGSGESARPAAAALVARVRKDCADRTLARLLLVIAEGLSADTARPGIPARQLERWEAELFETAAAKALKRDVHAPELARNADAARHAVGVRLDVRPPLRSRASRPRERGSVGTASSRIVVPIVHRLSVWRAAIALRFERRPARSADGGSDRRRERTDEGAGAGGRAPGRRGRRAMVAAAAASAVLACGLLWPGGATGEPDGGIATAGPKSTPRATEVERASAEPSATPSPPAPAPVPPSEGTPQDGSDPVDPVDAARMLIDAIGICGEKEDPVCGGAVAPGSVGVVDALGGGGDGPLQLEPVDEYGDVAVIRVTSSGGRDEGAASGGAERMVVLVRIAEKWLVRDVYDVADQPG